MLCYDRPMPREASGRRVLDAFSAERRLHAVRAIVTRLSPRFRRMIRKGFRWCEARLGDVVDAAESATGRRDSLMPPRRMIGVGSNSIIRSDYRAIGQDLVDLAVRLAGLRPEHSVLEVGSGTGRIAATLTTVLSEQGSFDGFDIVKEGVEWCQTHITPRYPRFRFRHANVFNATYNPDSPARANSYQFPYEDGRFDVVIATSVLTHMYRDDAAHYLREIARVLKGGGRTFITHFLWTPETRALAVAGRSAMNFRFPVPDGLTIDETEPEAAIAIDVQAVRSDYERAGLVIESLNCGRWSGATEGIHFQDVVVARKPA
jgi:SAM-dependent methyltransferase